MIAPLPPPTNPTLRGLFDINDFGDGAIYTNAAAPTRSEFCQATLTELASCRRGGDKKRVLPSHIDRTTRLSDYGSDRRKNCPFVPRFFQSKCAECVKDNSPGQAHEVSAALRPRQTSIRSEERRVGK